MPVVKKVQSKVVKKEAAPVAEVKAEESQVSASENKDGSRKEAGKTKKYCQFCKSKSEPRYWDASSLRRFLSDRGRIYIRTRTGTCSKHQRRVSREIKRARQLALLPFVVRA